MRYKPIEEMPFEYRRYYSLLGEGAANATPLEYICKVLQTKREELRNMRRDINRRFNTCIGVLYKNAKDKPHGHYIVKNGEDFTTHENQIMSMVQGHLSDLDHIRAKQGDEQHE